jgi:hypothetical protein
MYNSNVIRTVLTSVLVAGFAAVASAQTRTWVSGTGNDANPCSRTAPCQTFAGAISKTATGGEISVLDPGGFGTVNITKAITINGTGSLAGILNSGTTGVIVNAPATDTVILRDISINGATTGLNGVSYLAGKTLMIDHCWIYGQVGSATARGINVNKTAAGNLKVLNSIIENVTEDGIHSTTTVGQVLMTIDHTNIMNCGGDGIEGVANNLLALSNSRITNNGNGIRTTGSGNQFNLDDVLVSYSNLGLQASAGSTFRVSDSIIAQNATGLSQNGGVIDSFQGNSLMGNTTPGAFSSTTNKQ